MNRPLLSVQCTLKSCSKYTIFLWLCQMPSRRFTSDTRGKFRCKFASRIAQFISLIMVPSYFDQESPFAQSDYIPVQFSWLAHDYAYQYQTDIQPKVLLVVRELVHSVVVRLIYISVQDKIATFEGVFEVIDKHRHFPSLCLMTDGER